MAYEEYVIEDFMNAWFKGKYNVMTKEAFDEVYAEYSDTSGLFLSEDFERQSYILHLTQRLNYVSLLVGLQRDFLNEFGKPFERDFDTLKQKYGYILKWNGDKEDFEKQLKRVEAGEGRFETELKAKIKELKEYRKNKEKGKPEETEEESLQKSRRSFVRMLNSLGKIGFIVNKKETTVEELALMIKQQFEEKEFIESKYGR